MLDLFNKLISMNKEEISQYLKNNKYNKIDIINILTQNDFKVNEKWSKNKMIKYASEELAYYGMLKRIGENKTLLNSN